MTQSRLTHECCIYCAHPRHTEITAIPKEITSWEALCAFYGFDAQGYPEKPHARKLTPWLRWVSGRRVIEIDEAAAFARINAASRLPPQATPDAHALWLVTWEELPNESL